MGINFNNRELEMQNRYLAGSKHKEFVKLDLSGELNLMIKIDDKWCRVEPNEVMRLLDMGIDSVDLRMNGTMRRENAEIESGAHEFNNVSYFYYDKGRNYLEFDNDSIMAATQDCTRAIDWARQSQDAKVAMGRWAQHAIDSGKQVRVLQCPDWNSLIVSKSDGSQIRGRQALGRIEQGDKIELDCADIINPVSQKSGSSHLTIHSVQDVFYVDRSGDDVLFVESATICFANNYLIHNTMCKLGAYPEKYSDWGNSSYARMDVEYDGPER